MPSQVPIPAPDLSLLDSSRRRGKIINPLLTFAIKPDFDTRPRPGFNHLSAFTMLYT
jgi:hypothetical protein